MATLSCQEMLKKKLPLALGLSIDEFIQGSSVFFDENGPFSVQQCMHYMNTCQDDLARHAAIRESFYLKKTYDMNIPTGSLRSYEQRFPLPMDMANHVCLDAIDSRTGERISRLRYRQETQNYTDLNQDYRHQYYSIQDDEIIIYRPVYNDYRLTYQRYPSRLFFGSVTDSGTTTTAVNASVVLGGEPNFLPGAYVGDRIEVFNQQRQGSAEVRKIVGFDKTTGILQLDPTNPLPFAPTTANGPGVWEYSIIPFLRDSDNELFIYGTARKFLGEYPDGAANCEKIYFEKLDEFLQVARSMDVATPQSVIVSDTAQGFTLSRPRTGFGGWR